MASPLKGWLHAPAESSDTMPVQLPTTVTSADQVTVTTSAQDPADAPYLKIRSTVTGFGSVFGPAVTFTWTNYSDHDAGIDYEITI